MFRFVRKCALLFLAFAAGAAVTEYANYRYAYPRLRAPLAAQTLLLGSAKSQLAACIASEDSLFAEVAQTRAQIARLDSAPPSRAPQPAAAGDYTVIVERSAQPLSPAKQLIADAVRLKFPQFSGLVTQLAGAAQPVNYQPAFVLRGDPAVAGYAAGAGAEYWRYHAAQKSWQGPFVVGAFAAGDAR